MQHRIGKPVSDPRGAGSVAEEMYGKALAIEEEALGRKEGMASDYGNLGILYRTRGKLDRAEECTARRWPSKPGP
ncbi:MAG: tetratricopeptide repeat protein [Nitrospirales bacterium]|nr:tetratricopeptide repeat protein [Nitrospirales bacterium]